MQLQNTITKDKIAKGLQSEMGISCSICEELVDIIFDEMTQLILRDGKLMLHKFGTWKVNHKKGRPGYNISSNVAVHIPPRSVLQFTSSQLLRGRLNAGE